MGTATTDWVLPILAQRVTFDPSTGLFTWNPKTGESRHSKWWNTRFSGRVAGSINRRGYVSIGISIGRVYYQIQAHRLAMLLVTGVPPIGEVDHINGVRSDNRGVNLRDGSNAVNQKNAGLRRDSTSGITGVYWRKDRQQWQASIFIGGRLTHLGYFTDKLVAAKTARDARAVNGYTNRNCKGGSP